MSECVGVCVGGWVSVCVHSECNNGPLSKHQSAHPFFFPSTDNSTICVCVCVCVCVCMCVHAHIHLFILYNMYAFVCPHTCKHACEHAYNYMNFHAFISSCVSLYGQIFFLVMIETQYITMNPPKHKPYTWQ